MHNRRLLAIALVAGLSAVPVGPVGAQNLDSCTGGSCALRIEYRALGDRLIRPDGSVAAVAITPRSLSRTVGNAPAATPFVEAFAKATQRSQRWSLLGALATVGWISAERNGLSSWDSGHRAALIAGSLAVGVVSGAIAGRYTRESFVLRQLAVDAYNAAQP